MKDNDLFTENRRTLFPVFGKTRSTAALSAILFALIAVLIFVIIQAIASAVFLISLTVTGGASSSEEVLDAATKNVVLSGLIGNVAALGAAILYIKLRRFRLTTSLDIYKPKALSVIFCIILGVALNFFTDFAISIIPFPKSFYSTYEEIYSYMGNGSFAVEVIAVAVVAPIVEEVFFRGIAYGTMRGRMPKWAAVVLSSLMFGAAHGNVLSLIFTFVLGVILALLFEKTGTIIIPILVHAAFNASSYLVSALLDSTDPSYYYLICAAGAAASAVTYYLTVLPYKRGKHNEQTNLPSQTGEDGAGS